MKSLLGNLNLASIFTPQVLVEVVRIVAIVVVGFFVTRVLGALVRRVVAKNLTEQSRIILYRAVVYTGVTLIVVAILGELGVKLSALLGAAGIVGVTVGVASQTSLGNIISGLFLVSEKTFGIGDVITVGDKTGIVISIDLLSVKMRTFDNLLIRIPNQTIIGSVLTNVTRFPIRRVDFNLGVAYRSNPDHVRNVLLAIAREHHLVLEEPAPIVMFTAFAESSLSVFYGVWCHKDNFVDVKNGVFSAIRERFEREGIEFPFPQTTLTIDPAQSTLSVRLAGERADAARSASDRVGAARHAARADGIDDPPGDAVRSSTDSKRARRR